jgi:hypothetical protein
MSDSSVEIQLPNQVAEEVTQVTSQWQRQQEKEYIDNSRSLIQVQTRLYTDMNEILLEIYGTEPLIVCRQLKVQNIIQKHFISMRNDLNNEIRKAIGEVRSKKSWWKKILCR